MIENPTSIAYRRVWGTSREGFTPGFRAEIDRLVAEAEGAAAPR